MLIGLTLVKLMFAATCFTPARSHAVLRATPAPPPKQSAGMRSDSGTRRSAMLTSLGNGGPDRNPWARRQDSHLVAPPCNPRLALLSRGTARCCARASSRLQRGPPADLS